MLGLKFILIFASFHLVFSAENIFNAKVEEYPFLVRVYRNYNEMVGICGGVYIHFKWVLTSAHCVNNDLKFVNTYCCMGSEIDDTGNGPKGCRHYRAVIRIIVPNESADFALLKLIKPFELSDKIKLGILVKPGFGESEVIAGKTCTAAGWSELRILLKTNVTVAKLCPWENYLCVFSLTPGVCVANSGSPVICSGVIVGLLSGLEGGSSNGNCSIGPDNYTTYIQLDKYIGEINAVLKSEFKTISSAKSNLFIKNHQNFLILIILFLKMFCK